MADGGFLKKLFYGGFGLGVRARGVQRKRYQDTLKSSVKNWSIDLGNWENIVVGRSARWSQAVNSNVEKLPDETTKLTKGNKLNVMYKGNKLKEMYKGSKVNDMYKENKLK